MTVPSHGCRPGTCRPGPSTSRNERSNDGFAFPKERTTRAFESLATYLDEGALDGATVHRGSEKGQLERPQILIVDGEPTYLYVATGIIPKEGFGSCSHVFKLNVERK